MFSFCSLDTDVEDLKEQESVSRILAELLENQEEFFDAEEDDISNTNDYSSINDQVNLISFACCSCPLIKLCLFLFHKGFVMLLIIVARVAPVNRLLKM